MEVGQGPNWGCSAKEKKYVLRPVYGSILINNNWAYGLN
jgi:hypothetical protein